MHKPKNNVFFNSDDSLFKTEKRKFVIPRIEIQSDEPVFSLQVTDFSEPKPKNVTLMYDESGQTMKLQKVEEYVKPKTKAQEFAQNKSFSIDVNTSCVDINTISETDKFLSIGTKKLARQKPTSTSLGDLSSSTSSINSCIYESNFDLSQIDPDTPLKHWKSPFEIRHAKNLEKDNKATSEPVLNKKKYVITSRSKSVSEENLNDKLTEYERLEILKLLHDWSLNGSESKSEFNINLNKARSIDNIDSIARDDEIVNNLKKIGEKFCSEPDLSPKSRQNRGQSIVLGKYSSDSKLPSTVLEDDFLHKCQYRNCIFNVDFTSRKGTNYTSSFEKPLKSILKNSRESVRNSNDSLKENNNNDCLNNITNLQINGKPKNHYDSRRYSDVIQTNKPINSDMIRCDSLERLTQMRKPKKFPESYIVSRKGSFRTQRLKNSENGQRPKSPKVIVLRKKCIPKTWKSCSDIKPKKPVKKCCKYAKKSCPVLKSSSDSPRKARKTKSCACISEENILESVSADKSQKSGQRVCFAEEEIVDSFDKDQFQDSFDSLCVDEDKILPMPVQRPGFAKQYSLNSIANRKLSLGQKSLLFRQSTMPETSRYCVNCQKENDLDPFIIRQREDICYGGQQQQQQQQQHTSARLAVGFSPIPPGSACLVHRKIAILSHALSFFNFVYLHC